MPVVGSDCDVDTSISPVTESEKKLWNFFA